jgi:hypothetical protein
MDVTISYPCKKPIKFSLSRQHRRLIQISPKEITVM